MAPHKHTRVVVDAKKVDGGGDNRKISCMDWWRSDAKIGKKIFRVVSTEERIEEPAIAKGIGLLNRKQCLGTIIGCVDRIKVEGNAYLRLRREVFPQTRHRETMREQNMMTGTHCQLFIAKAGSMDAQSITEVGTTPGFVVREPPVNAVS